MGARTEDDLDKPATEMAAVSCDGQHMPPMAAGEWSTNNMRALVIGNDATLAMNIVSALAAVGAEADVISAAYLPRLRSSCFCRDYVRVSHASLDFAAPGGTAARFIASYCQTYEIDIVIPADLPTTIGLAQLADGVLPLVPVASSDILATLQGKRFARDARVLKLARSIGTTPSNFYLRRARGLRLGRPVVAGAMRFLKMSA